MRRERHQWWHFVPRVAARSLTARCPKCGVLAQVWCRTANGSDRQAHVKRIRAIVSDDEFKRLKQVAEFANSLSDDGNEEALARWEAEGGALPPPLPTPYNRFQLKLREEFSASFA